MTQVKVPSHVELRSSFRGTASLASTLQKPGEHHLQDDFIDLAGLSCCARSAQLEAHSMQSDFAKR